MFRLLPVVLLLFSLVPLRAQIRGAALWSAGQVASWGGGVEMHDLRTGLARTLARGDFGEGGCAVTLADGRRGLVLQQGQGLGKLVWLAEAAGWTPEVMDTEAETHDCLAATVHGRRGVLVVHRYGQVRFYEPGRKRGAPWQYTEIYSFYTASRQGGLLLQDVDGDDRPDILCGDYWIRNPERFELGWRLFALHLWFEDPESALVRMASAGKAVVEAQAHVSPARLAWFEPPADVRQQWTQTRIGEELRLRRIHGLDAADVDGDGRIDIVAAENAGPRSRVVLFRNQGGGAFVSRVLSETGGVVFLKVLGNGTLVTAGEDGVHSSKIGNK